MGTEGNSEIAPSALTDFTASQLADTRRALPYTNEGQHTEELQEELQLYTHLPAPETVLLCFGPLTARLVEQQ